MNHEKHEWHESAGVTESFFHGFRAFRGCIVMRMKIIARVKELMGGGRNRGVEEKSVRRKVGGGGSGQMREE